MRVYEDTIQFPDGSESVYGLVEKEDAALVIPVHGNKRFQLVQQFRYPVSGRYWEFPRGSWQARPQIDIEAVALGELEEETGYRAQSLHKLGQIFQACGVASHSCHVFVATGLAPGQLAREKEEQDMVTANFSQAEVHSMIRTGQIRDATTIAAFGLLMLEHMGCDLLLRME